VKSAENLDPKKALESLSEGELTSLQAVSQALGLGSTLASPPSIYQLQGYMRSAIEAIRLRQKALAWNQGDSDAQAIATVGTNNLLLAKASFDQASYKPAILRYSFTPKPAQDAKAPPMGLIDIVLVLPDGEPKGWRVEVPIARLREVLARHYANMAGMGPVPGGNPAATPAASQLAQLLLEPVQPTLKANGITSLIISSDLNLIDVPYASLPLGSGFLAERYAVTITPSLALTSLTSYEKPPIYGKDSLIRAGATEFANGLAPLPMVAQELTTIAREDGGTVLLNQAFNANSLLKVLADPAVKRIHIASHAELKPGKEGDARIHTSSNSVGLKEMGQLRQRSAGQGLDLVSLSACRSAVSGSDLELGFAGMAIQLGSKSAIGTKWYVDDLATSSFFVQFYRYLDQGIPKAEAIQMTQKAFLSGEVHLQGDKVVGSGGSTLMAGLTPAQQRRYAGGFSHPYFWASVQLVGSPW
jgi:CHAT domain-containing protein